MPWDRPLVPIAAPEKFLFEAFYAFSLIKQYEFFGTWSFYMNIRQTILALAASVALASPGNAVSVGAPFFEIDGSDVSSASILDFFDIFGPSGIKEVSLAGTVSSSVGAPSTVGSAFSFSTSVGGGFGTASLTLGATTLSAFEILDASTGPTVQDFDPFQEGPGDLNFRMLILPPFLEPVFGTFQYTGDFADWPDRTADFPEFEVVLSVYLDAPLPTRTFDDGFSTFDFIEGPLSVDRITFGTVDGEPLIAPVPIPAGLPLLAGALLGFVVIGRRQVPT